MTAVEWLVKTLELDTRFNGIMNDVIEQAKKMEKEKSIAELRHKDGTPMRKYNSPKLQAIEMENKLQEAAETNSEKHHYAFGQQSEFYQIGFIEGAKWQVETFPPQTEISDKVLFEQATVAMEERYGSGCEEEIDAYFRGAKWMINKIQGGNK